MTLQEAKTEAAARSKRSGKKAYIIAVEGGACIINDAPLKGHIHTYENGVEIPKDTPVTEKPIKLGKPLENKSAKVAAEPKATVKKEIKTNKKMSTATKKSPAKKVAKKVAAPVKKTAAGLPAGKKMTMKAKDIVKYLKAGKGVYRPDNGRRMNLKFNESLDPNKEREVIFAG